jgi:hypothetical protein
LSQRARKSLAAMAPGIMNNRKITTARHVTRLGKTPALRYIFWM